MKKALCLFLSVVVMSLALVGCTTPSNSGSERAEGSCTSGREKSAKDDSAVQASSQEETLDEVNNSSEDVSATTASDSAEIGTSQTYTSDGSTRIPVSSDYISAETQEMLNSIDTDFTKVNWGVVYSIPDMEGIVISLTPYIDGSSYFLIIGITNLYNEDITFSAEGYAKDSSGNNIADIFFFDEAIRSGNTVVHDLYCSGQPTGEIHWDNIEFPNVYSESANWECDWGMAQDSDGYVNIEYQMYGDEKMQPGYVNALVLDPKGYVIGFAKDYNTEEDTLVSGTIKTFKKDFNGTPVDVAFFSNPIKK